MLIRLQVLKEYPEAGKSWLEETGRGEGDSVLVVPLHVALHANFTIYCRG